MPEDLAQLVRSLSPGGLDSFKKQLQALPEAEKQRAFSRLSGIAELSDIIGRPTPMREIETPSRPQPTAQPPTMDIPFWQRALQTVGTPFQWISQNITEPFGAYAAAPFTPAVAGTEGMGFFERERAEYKGWEGEPKFRIPGTEWDVGVKGVLETLPWLMLPSAGTVAGRLGAIAASGGALGRGAALAGKVVAPIAMVESLPGKAIGKAIGKGKAKGIPKELQETLTDIEERMSKGLISEDEARKQLGIAVEKQVVKAEARVTPAPEVTYYHTTTAETAKQIERAGFKAVTGERVYQNTVAGTFLYPNDIEAAQIFGKNLKSPRIIETKVSGRVYDANTQRLYGWENDLQITEIARDRNIINQLKKDGYVGITSTELNTPVTFIFEPSAIKLVIPKAGVGIPPTKPPLPPTAVGGALPEPPIPPTPPIPPVGAKITSELFPEGYKPAQEAGIKWITDAIKEAKPIRARTEKLYTEARAEQIAAYETKLEQLTKEGVAPREALEEARKALYLGGELPTAKITPGFTSVADKLTEDMGQALWSVIRDAPYKSNFDRVATHEAFGRLLDPIVAGLPRDFELKLLEKTFGSGLVKELLKKRPWGTRAWELAIDIANAPRAFLASMDVSGLLRQGGILVARHPIEGTKTLRPMFESLFSDKNALLTERIIMERVGMDELVDEALRVPLYLAPLPTKVAVKLAEREEAFMTAVFSKLPFIKASNRAFVTGLNDLRSHSALNVLHSWKKAGIAYTKEDISDLNQLVNFASGRGSLPEALSRHGALLSAFFFAPKLIMSRIQLPTTVLPMVTKSALVRREAWRTLLTAIGAGAGILTMAQLSGAGKIEFDPRSADFGKMRSGETRLDIWTGYSQYMRFLAQFATAQRKTVGGRIQALNRGEVAWRFIRTKFSPAAGLINDLVSGETFLGEELPPKSTKGVLGQLYQRMMPLAIQDMIDAVNQDGPLGGLVASGGFLGIGVVTYTDEAKRERDSAARAQYGMTWDEVGRQYGRATQLKLEQTTPAILEAEKEEEKRFGAGSPTAMQQWQREGRSVEDTYREAIGLATKEFRQTGDGVKFRDKVDSASYYRRQAYAARAKRTEFQDIIAQYQQPFRPEQIEKMNPGDVLRKEYYQTMFSLDMYDEFGNYLFDEAEKREQAFLTKYGQQALDYIEDYRGARWVDKPAELRMLEEARDLLRPYWQITDQIWSMYPPELKVLSDQIVLLERTDPAMAKQMIRRYPSILRARDLVAQYRKQMREYNPMIRQAHRLFYG